jgi:hypothetical protein
MNANGKQDGDGEDPKLNVLLRIGFVPIGEFVIEKSMPFIKYNEDSQSKVVSKSSPALYAFTVNGHLKYIGKTTRVLAKRLSEYCKPGETQRTNKKNHKNITIGINAGEKVGILGFAPDVPLCWAEFSINLPAGLEDALITMLDPQWNGSDSAGGCAQSESSVYENVAITGSEEPQGENEQISSQLPSFKIKLSATYYEKGIINPGVDMDSFIGKHQDPVNIHLGSIGLNVVRSTINRIQNPNCSVRINGGVQVARWFQKYFHVEDSVIANVHDCNNIVLLAPQVG